MAMEVAFFATALTSHVFPAIRKTIPFVVVPYAICFLTWATVVGFVRFVTGRQRVTWDRGTPSGATASGATP
jgi:hypothetical protein